MTEETQPTPELPTGTHTIYVRRNRAGWWTAQVPGGLVAHAGSAKAVCEDLAFFLERHQEEVDAAAQAREEATASQANENGAGEPASGSE